MINIVPIVSEGPLNFNSSIDVVRAFFFVYAPFLYLSLSHTQIDKFKSCQTWTTSSRS